MPPMSKKLKFLVWIGITLSLFASLLFIRLYANKGISGDQVHYLVMANSLLKDGDFDLKNDYEPERYNAFYADKLDQHIPTRQFNQDSPKLYSLHNPGLPILISPFMAVFGYKGAIILMIFISILLLLLTYYWAEKISKNKKAALFATFILFVSVFYLSLEGYIFPNLLIAVMTLGSLLILENKNRPLWQLLLLGILLGSGPFIHVKTLMSFAMIGLIAIIQILKNKKPWKNKSAELSILIVPALILIAIFEWKLYEWYGVFLPNQTFAGDILFLVSPFKSLAAILFDSTKGLFINNPALILIFLGLPLWFKENRWQIFRIILILGPSFILQLSFLDWWGGWSPSGRYLMDMLPVLIPALAFIYPLLKNLTLKIFTYILIGLQIIFSLIYIFSKSSWVWSGVRNPIFEIIQSKIGLAIDRFLPQFSPELHLKNTYGGVFLTFFIIIAATLLVSGIKLSRQKSE